MVQTIRAFPLHIVVSSFEFQETDDQMRAIEDVKKDMEKLFLKAGLMEIKENEKTTD